MKLTTVTFVFDGELPVGEAVLTCKFKGILNGDMSGFYKSNYSDADGNKKVMASTQFEVCKYIYIYIYIYMCIHICTCICICVYVYTFQRYVYICIYVYVYILMAIKK
jgi:hypothetical protein